MVRYMCTLSLAVMAVTFVVFYAFPELDIATTRLFFEPKVGFPLGQYPEISLFQKALRWLSVTFAALMVLGFAVSFLRLPAVRRLVRHRRAFVYFFLVVALGLGAVINGFKDHWGRPRPSHTTEFLGTYAYVPPLIMSDACERNCSFPAGDPAVGFALVAFALVFRRRQRQFLILALAAGAALGVMRIAMGGHYLSDVIFSGAMMFFVAKALYVLLYEKLKASWLTGYQAPPVA